MVGVIWFSTLSGNGHDVTHFSVKSYLPGLGPGMKGVVVFL